MDMNYTITVAKEYAGLEMERGFIKEEMRRGIQCLINVCFGRSLQAGWWPVEKTNDGTVLLERNRAEMICLMHSELSEAMEGERKDLMDDKLPHRKMAEVEMADAVIRIADYCGGFGYDLAGAILEKLEYNRTRADHQLANRAAEGGKKF